MTDTYNIERSILASVLNSEIDIELNKNYFTTLFHQKLVSGINRLKELDEYIDFETIRNKFLKANKWTYEEDNMLIDTMTNTTPFGSKKTVDSYISILKDSYKNSLDRKFSL